MFDMSAGTVTIKTRIMRSGGNPDAVIPNGLFTSSTNNSATFDSFEIMETFTPTITKKKIYHFECTNSEFNEGDIIALSIYYNTASGGTNYVGGTIVLEYDVNIN